MPKLKRFPDGVVSGDFTVGIMKNNLEEIINKQEFADFCYHACKSMKQGCRNECTIFQLRAWLEKESPSIGLTDKSGNV